MLLANSPAECVLLAVEQFIYNMILPVLNVSMPIEQAEFRPGPSCCDQDLSLTFLVKMGLSKSENIINFHRSKMS